MIELPPMISILLCIYRANFSDGYLNFASEQHSQNFTTLPIRLKTKIQRTIDK